MSDKSPDEISGLIDRLSPEEKAALVIGADFWRTAALPRHGVDSIMVSDGPHGLRAQAEGGDHLGLSGSLPATCFPTASAIASAWNPDLMSEVGVALAREARACGVLVVLGPGINMKRSPLCGRNFEYLSEDPLLAGVLATAMVHGVQSLGVGTSLKHFAANNQETDRLRVSAEVDERTLREIYLPAFERVITQARPWTVMCAYNKINGVYASEHRWLLTDLLRGEWGFEGVVVSDWGAVHDRVAALRAGLDLEMPPAHGVSDLAVVEAINSGELAVSVLDESVARVLRLARQSAAAQSEGDVFGEPEQADHHALARRAARQSAVLLKNEGGVLPITPAAASTVAVIGEFARTPRYQGSGSSQVNPTRLDVALDELRAALEPAVAVEFAAGFGLDGPAVDETLHAAAVELAGRAEVVLVFLGLPDSAESEGFDRTTMALPANQLALIDAVSAVHDRVVVVLAGGSTVQLSTWQGGVAAILQCWLSGQAAGGAAADLLLGTANPGGKLAESIPLRLEDNSSFLNFPGEEQQVRYGEGIFIGYRGYDAAQQQVSYPFGFGLSYTSFALSDVELIRRGSVEADNLVVEVAVTVTNTGQRAGAEVVQVYVGDVAATVSRPPRELKAFRRVELAPGEHARIELDLDDRAFAFWSTRLHRWAVGAGEFEIAVGTSSRDLVETRIITLDAPSLAAPIDADSTLQEWLADQRGRVLLVELLGEEIASDAMADLITVIGTMPMSTLASFGGEFGFDHRSLQGLVDQL